MSIHPTAVALPTRAASLASLAIGIAGLFPLPLLAATPWAAVSLPSAGPTEVIGSTSNGCIGGAEALPETGPGYVSVRRYRNHFYGHPDLIRLVQDLGRSERTHGPRLMMVGDLSQPRGGRMPSGHRSHQNGLDVDIWFTLTNSPGDASRLMDNRGDPPSMVAPGGFAVSGAWGDEQRFLLQTTARHPAVDRIFVNPAIKREICRTTVGDRSWLRKVRPWWGHDAHFHVRMSCPPGSPLCSTQAPLPPGDGCGESDLAWWFEHKAKGPVKKAEEAPPSQPVMPAACLAVLRDS